MTGKLSNRVIEEITDASTVADGGGLYLQTTESGTKSWLYRYQIGGKRRWMGLGSYPTVSTSKARVLRDELRRQVKAGIDPLNVKQEAKIALAAKMERERRNSVTFKQCAEEFIAAKEAGWRNPKHRQQWRNTLTTYAYPVVGSLPLAEISTEHILSILQPIWVTKTETATRIQGRLEHILDYARSKGLREGENPARWRGHLNHLLPSPSKVAPVQHQRALRYTDAPELATKLRELNTPASRALLLTLLCATRTSDTLQATWDEFDLDSGLWIIPGERMKAGKEHRIPLSEAAIALLGEPRESWLFPGQKRGRPLSDMAMTNVLKRIGWLERTTVHGLRSTFRNWAGETNYPDRMAEVALAHQLSDKVQAAYFRSDLMEQRRQMMEAWAGYLLSQKSEAEIVPLKRGQAS